MVISSLTGVNSPVTVTEVPKVETSTNAAIKQISPKEVEAIMTTEEYVKEYFKDIPIMVKVAKCESTFRHLRKDGEVHRGKVNNKDVGVMQINEYYHLETSQKLGYDIYTIEGNTAYARYLYEKQGTQPWVSSKPCWGKFQNPQPSQPIVENNDLAINLEVSTTKNLD